MNTKLPELFLKRLAIQIPPSHLQEVIDSFSAIKPPTVRVNRLKITYEELDTLFKRNNISMSRFLWCYDAGIVTNVTARTLTETDLYKKGLFYLQGLSSLVPTLALDPQPYEKVLDMTAAPGSKTTHIAALMNNTGEIIANDISRTRMFKMRSILKQMGIENTTLTNTLGEQIWKKYPEYFDKVLLDAPCSMEGTFNTHDVASFANWNTGLIKKLAKQQKWLLRAAISATRVGGHIVYSTCTLSPEENEGVTEWILNKEPHSVKQERIDISNLTIHDGRIYPSRQMEGFYIAKFVKVASNIL